MAEAATVDVAEVLETRKVRALAQLRTFHAQRSERGLGRRTSALSAVLIYSLAATACGFITSLHQLLWWRLAAGLGFGGIMPAIAYIVEMAPRRYCAEAE
jgi:MFS family permease